MKNREAYYDQLRVLAIISIICCHIGAIMLKNHDMIMHFKSFYAICFLTLGRFIGIPIFVMLSGALLINKNYSLSDFVKKRFNRVFIPFIFWFIVYVLFYYAVNSNALTFDLIISMFFGLKGSGAYLFWFIWMLVVVYISIFIINKSLEYVKSKSDNHQSRLIDILVILSLMCYVGFNLGIVVYSNKVSFYCMFIPYAIIGYFLTHYEFTDIKIAKYNITPGIIVITTFIVFLLGYICFAAEICLNSVAANKFTACDYFDYRVVIVTFALMMFFRYLPKCNGKVTENINNCLSSDHISKAILSVSLCSYGIYFVHFLILRYLEIYYIVPFELYNHPKFWTPVLIIFIFFSSWILIRILSRIPYINKISGVS